MTGEGRESGGAGSARMTLESRVAALPSGETEVTVLADVDVIGRLVQFGRGMIEQVSHQIFLELSRCIRGRLEAEAGGAAAAPPPRQEAVRAVPLVMKALLAWLASLLRRLLGGPGR
jgi:hypothetical protein